MLNEVVYEATEVQPRVQAQGGQVDARAGAAVPRWHGIWGAVGAYIPPRLIVAFSRAGVNLHTIGRDILCAAVLRKNGKTVREANLCGNFAGPSAASLCFVVLFAADATLLVVENIKAINLMSALIMPRSRVRVSVSPPYFYAVR
jgi:hypothetical protein